MSCSPLDRPTNQDVLDIWNSCTPALAIQQLRESYPNQDWSQTTQVKTKLKRLDERVKKLKRNKNDGELKSVCFSIFEIPASRVIDGITAPDLIHQQIRLSAIKVQQQNKDLKRDLDTLEDSNENLTLQISHDENKISILSNLLEITNDKYKNACSYKKKSQEIRIELQQWEEKYEDLARRLDEVCEDLQKKKDKLSKITTRNVTKKLKRRDETIERRDMELAEKETEIKTIKQENELKNDQITVLQREKKNLLVKVCRLRKDCIYDKNLDEIANLKNEIQVRENQIIYLEQTNALLQDPVIDCFYDGKYSNEIRETIMTLILECGVSQKKVNEVVKTVVKNLTGKSLSRLPSTGVKNRLITEAKRIAQKQVAMAMLSDIDELPTSNCLHQDGTSKFHRHFQSFQVTTAQGKTLSAGLAEVARGDATSLFDEFNSLVKDIADSIDPALSVGLDRDIGKLVVSIVATMSDQGSTNPVFNDKLKTLREELLPTIAENWDTMSQNERDEVSKLFSFFCKMHIFVNMATETDKCLSQFEAHIIADGRNPYAFISSESGASRFLRTASKALTTRGCEKSGVGDYFVTYLRDKAVANQLITFRGHRFNHLYYAAGATFYHINDIKDFLQKWSDPNDLLKSIQFDAEEIVYVSEIRALGLIDKLITGPFWRLIESVKNVLDLNQHLLQMKITLEAWSKDASPVLAGEPMFSEEQVSITKDDVYESLVAPAENPMLDTYTQMALELSFGGMLLILERQAKDQLPGGKYCGLSNVSTNKLENVPTTNTVSERDFAQLDMLMRAKPSASTTAYESIIMWSNNKTSSWLHSMSETDRDKILDQARKHAPEMKIKIKIKQQKLYTAKLERLQERQEKKEKKENKIHSTKVRLTQQITNSGGLWMSSLEIDSYKSAETETSKYKEALLNQILFRKSVLCSKGPKHLFQQTYKGKVYSVADLEQNLRNIILLNENEEQEQEQEACLTYKTTEEVSEAVVILKQSLKSRIEDGRTKIIVSQQKDLLPSLLESPETLVGKSIRHKLRDPDTREVEWFKGIVLGIAKKTVVSIKTEYSVKYDEEVETWQFPLLRDLSNGDLIITSN